MKTDYLSPESLRETSYRHAPIPPVNANTDYDDRNLRHLHRASKLLRSATIVYFLVLMISAIGLFLANTLLIRAVFSSLGIASLTGLICTVVPAQTYQLLIRPPIVAFMFVIVYSLIGLLPLSQYRDYVDRYFWLYNSTMAISGFGIGALLSRIQLPTINLRGFQVISTSQFNMLMIFNMFVGIAAAGMLLVSAGGAAFDPNARFGVSPLQNVLIESQICAWAFLASSPLPLKGYKKGLLFLSIVSMLLAGYRNFFVFLLVTITWCRSLKSSNDGQQYYVPAGISIALFMIVSFLGLVYIYRGENGDGLNLRGSIAEHRLVAAEYLTPVIPFHIYAREGIGVAQVAHERRGDLYRYGDPSTIYFTDILAMLPGRDGDFGSMLGEVVNNSKTDTLTLSLPGGVLVGFGRFWILPVFLIFGLVIGKLSRWAPANAHPVDIASVVIFSVYFIGLTVKGYPKIAFLVMLLYVVFSKLFVSRRTYS